MRAPINVVLVTAACFLAGLGLAQAMPDWSGHSWQVAAAAGLIGFVPSIVMARFARGGSDFGEGGALPAVWRRPMTLAGASIILAVFGGSIGLLASDTVAIALVSLGLAGGLAGFVWLVLVATFRK